MINHLEACFPTAGRDFLPAVHGEEMVGFRDWLASAAPARCGAQAFRVTGSFESDDVSA